MLSIDFMPLSKNICAVYASDLIGLLVVENAMIYF